MMRLGLVLATVLLTGSAAPAMRDDWPSPVQVIDAINIARASPLNYADALKDLQPRFQGNLYRDRDYRDGLITNEGFAAVSDAITELSSRAPVQPVQMSDILNQAARKHVEEQGPLGTTGHQSPDGKGPGQRLVELGGDRYVAEMIAYSAPSADAVARMLAVDDGVRDRGHRHILFSPEYHYAGAACGPHKLFGEMCVVEFSATPNGAPVTPH